VIVTFFDAIHKSESYFDDAKSFKPSRWLSDDKQKVERYEAHLLAFGHGPRVCPGQRLAMLEAIIAVAALVYEFDMTLACDPKEVHRVLLFTAVPDKLPVILTPVR
jgi:cytochrome P450